MGAKIKRIHYVKFKTLSIIKKTILWKIVFVVFVLLAFWGLRPHPHVNKIVKINNKHGELRKVTSSNNPNDSKCIVEKPLDEPIFAGEKAADGSQLRPFIVFFGESVPNMGYAERIVQTADIFVIIGTSLQVYPAAYLKEKVAWMIPCFVIDPGEFWAEDFYGFKHIKTTAVAGIDILKEKLKTL